VDKYNIIRSFEDILQLDEFLMNGDKPRFEILSVDTETNGLAFWKDVIIGLSISTDSKSGFYIPFLHWVPTDGSQNSKGVYTEGRLKDFWRDAYYPEDVTQDQYKPPEWLADFLTRWIIGADTKLLMHNAPFDCLVLEKASGVDLSPHVLCDTVLLKHVLDENTSAGLKEIAKLWQKDLGISADQEANQEQLEMGDSVIKNGGTYNKSQKHIWRADLEVLGKYAVADTFLTYGVFEVGMQKFSEEESDKRWKWFFEEEVMPLCREVVIPMRRNGVRINVQHFVEMETETHQKLQDLEHDIIKALESSQLLQGFTKGKSIDASVTKRKLIERIIELENLPYPIQKGKESLAKKAVQDAYDKDPHWLWGYILGYNELRYSEDRLNEIKKELYIASEGRRFQFNINSDQHLRWLFCSKLGYDGAKLPQTESATPENVIPSMKAEVLETYFLQKHDFVKPLLLYKKLEKLYGTYILPAINLNYKGYLYMDMMQHGTISGRFACGGGFNLQTLPKVEETDKCYKCGSKDIHVSKRIKLLTNMHCNACNSDFTDILSPSAIKEGFISPEGMDIANADYSSLEPRCFAEVSGDPKLKEVYLANLDLYSKIYCDMEDKDGKFSADPNAPNFLKKMDKSKRDMVKPVVLGIPYGARAPQVANLMDFKVKVVFQGEAKEFLDVERGKAFRDKYLDTYRELHKYMLRQEAEANANGFVETLVGRRRHFEFAPKVFRLLRDVGMDYEEFFDEKNKELKKMNYRGLTKAHLTKLSEELGFSLFDEKKKKYRDWGFVRSMYKNELNNAKNFPIQALGAHLTNRAMLDMTRKFKKAGLRAWVCLQVHDEITVYGEKSRIKEVVAIIQESMEHNIYTKLVEIPMIAEPLIASTLRDAK
jgi:DNA polymerase I-like protein with 3'-5' exonuclease and polymerase domains